ncbi:hypothetical protein [Gayadomonas joobiniege]|uniref:hypothetical protein n=1 Tax=Gayadomonas joobiniege TaxID=1234606 RepID=UPI00035E4898|nr:hypothetical protein [Gayadomonas joobiniege]
MSHQQTFSFLPADLSAQGFTLNYQLGETLFKEHYQIEGRATDVAAALSNDEGHKRLTYLSLAAGVSYFKLAPFSQIKTPIKDLERAESEFFNKLYVNGLAEFAYRNQLDLTQACQFPVGQGVSENAKTRSLQDASSQNEQNALVLIGGGKDSLVSIEKLKAAGIKQTLFAVNPAQPIIDCIKTSGLPYIFVRRQLDPELFKLNEAGALNGHVPITAIISFTAMLVAYLFGFTAVITSNESSANEATLIFNGRAVNHQYSKSLEFEQDFKAFSVSHLSDDIDYFSLLRPYSEFNIVSQFIRQQHYDDVFTSCNRAFKLYHEKSKTRWCLSCPKCHFVYLMFAAQPLSSERLQAIFAGNPLSDIGNLDSFTSLVGLSEHKPWECVGEKLESAACLYLLGHKPNFAQSSVVKALLPEVIEHYGEPQLELAVKHLTQLHDHYIPDAYLEALNG